MLRVLTIAPTIDGQPALAQTSELTRLGDVPGIDVDPLTGPLVTPERIQQRLRRHPAVLLWSGHGAAGRLLLPGGRDIEPRWLASACRQAGVSLCVLSVCDSAQRRGLEGFADTLPAAGVSVVAMSVAVTDTAAIDYDVVLLHALAGGETIREAHRIGVEAMGDNNSAPQLFMADRAAATELSDQADRLKAAVAAGRDGEEVADLIRACSETLRVLETNHGLLEARVMRLERAIKLPVSVRAWRALATALVVCGVLLFASHDSRMILFGLYPAIGIAGEALLLAFAALAWRMSDVVLMQDG